MGLKYLWDTNTVIYFLQDHFSGIEKESMNTIINTYQPAISAITQIELLCWKSASENDLIILKNFISDCFIFELGEDIKLKTIDIRCSYNIKLPDAIIAATAITMNLILITNDKPGFHRIPSLRLKNPFKI